MIRRYIATALIVCFFSYAAYLIFTDGGKPDSVITFTKLNNNIHKKFMILTGQQEAELTPEELAKEKELKEAGEREKMAIEKTIQDKKLAEKLAETEAALKALKEKNDSSYGGGSKDGAKK